MARPGAESLGSSGAPWSQSQVLLAGFGVESRWTCPHKSPLPSQQVTGRGQSLQVPGAGLKC